jgi:hypothetical protein
LPRHYAVVFNSLNIVFNLDLIELKAGTFSGPTLDGPDGVK